MTTGYAPPILRIHPPPTHRYRSPRVVIAHDFLTQGGGAERVVLALLEAFPNAPVVTSVYDPDRTFPEFKDVDIRTSSLQHLGPFRADPRRALAVLPRTWRNTTISDADVVIASSTGFAHGVRSTAPKIVYCHTPARWLYQPEQYLSGLPLHRRIGARSLARSLRTWDRAAAASASRYLANSTTVARRIAEVYGRKPEVLHPPLSLDAAAPRIPIDGLEPGFLLTVGRKRGYKNIGTACDAVELLPHERLVVVGDPPEPSEHFSSDRVIALGRVDDARLRWLYANCKGLIAPAYEDFGMTPVEAAAFGKPTVALRAGGYLDTVRPGVTGIFVDEVSPEAFAFGIETLSVVDFDPDVLVRHAWQFRKSAFIESIRAHVAAVVGAVRR